MYVCFVCIDYSIGGNTGLFLFYLSNYPTLYTNLSLFCLFVYFLLHNLHCKHWFFLRLKKKIELVLIVCYVICMLTFCWSFRLFILMIFSVGTMIRNIWPTTTDIPAHTKTHICYRLVRMFTDSQRMFTGWSRVLFSSIHHFWRKFSINNLMRIIDGNCEACSIYREQSDNIYQTILEASRGNYLIFNRNWNPLPTYLQNSSPFSDIGPFIYS